MEWVGKFLTNPLDLEHLEIVKHDMELDKWRYDQTPLNSIVIVSTMVDGCHFCIVPKEGASVDESPVYYVSPTDSEDTVEWCAKDFIDFLSITATIGNCYYIPCLHACEEDEFWCLVEEAWGQGYEWYEEEKAQKQKAIKLLEEHFPLRKYDNLFQHINESYADINNHAKLEFASENIKEAKQGHFRLVNSFL